MQLFELRPATCASACCSITANTEHPQNSASASRLVRIFLRSRAMATRLHLTQLNHTWNRLAPTTILSPRLGTPLCQNRNQLSSLRLFSLWTYRISKVIVGRYGWYLVFCS